MFERFPIPLASSVRLCGLARRGRDSEQQQWVRDAFAPVSEVLDAGVKLDILALTSSGPAYVALIADLADGAVAAGLPRDQAHLLAQRTLSGQRPAAAFGLHPPS